jgi:hypothetical protein
MAAKDAVAYRAGLPVCVPGQLFLGAAARHTALRSVYRICGFSIVAGVVLWVALRILLHHANNRELRTASVVMVCITFCQVFAGIAAYMTRIAYAGAAQPILLAPAAVEFCEAGLVAVV